MATATAITGVAGSAAKFFEGRKMQKTAQKMIDQFKWQDLKNPYAETSVSTLGADLQKEQGLISDATAVEALSKGGVRGLVGGLGQVQGQSNVRSKEIAAGLDEQQKQLDFAAAGQDVQNQMMIEKRQTDELAGYGQMMNTGMGMKMQGITDLANTMGMVGQTGLGKAVDGKVAGLFGKNFGEAVNDFNKNKGN